MTTEKRSSNSNEITRTNSLVSRNSAWFWIALAVAAPDSRFGQALHQTLSNLLASAIQRGQLFQPIGDFISQFFMPVTPRPITRLTRGQVHARFVPQAKHVLQRNNRGVGDRSQRGANEVPVNLLATAVQVFQAELALGISLSLAETREPTGGRIVVVRASISHNLARVVMREVNIRR